MVSHAETPLLVSAAQRGDRSAFAELYKRYAGMVHSIAAARVPIDAASDVVQDVFLRALRQLPTLRDAHAFGAWLARIARNVAHDMASAARDAGALDDEPSSPEHQQHHAEARRALHAIQSLPPAYRETLLMRLVYGMTGPEIAQQTGLSPDSVRVNLHRGMKLVRERLAGRGRKKRR